MDIVRDLGTSFLAAISPEKLPVDRVYAMGLFLCIKNDVLISDRIIRSSGVYMLYDETDVLYVGQSENVKVRIHHHSSIKFTGALIAYTQSQDLLAIEAMAIGILRPTLNHKQSTRYSPIVREDCICHE